jgi:sugar phosphate isomerase/epimerase
MKQNRRQFIQKSGMIAAGTFALPSMIVKGANRVTNATALIKGDLKQFGIQLYTLRNEMPKDPKGVMKKLSEYGYKTIESYEGDNGMFWGMTNKEFKAYMDELNMKIVSSHATIDDNWQRKAAEAAEIGMDYIICPWVGPQKSIDGWKKVTDQFNAAGEICKKEGIKFAYHNHEYTFKAFSGMIPHEYLMDNTDPELVKHEMDIYWVVSGQADPIDYLKKYSGRFTLCHVKDRLKDAPVDEMSASCVPGTGQIDFPKILKVAKDNGMEHFIVEQERYDGTTPFDAAKAGAKYLKDFKFA